MQQLYRVVCFQATFRIGWLVHNLYTLGIPPAERSLSGTILNERLFLNLSIYSTGI